MSNLIDFMSQLNKHKTRMQQIESDKMLALAETIRGQINSYHRLDGCTPHTIIAALTANLAAVIAKLDPKLEKLHVREIIYAHLDKMIDEELLQLWERGEVEPWEQDSDK